MEVKFRLGEINLYKDAWKISLNCSVCGVEAEYLENFLLHSLEHCVPTRCDDILQLVEQLNDVNGKNMELESYAIDTTIDDVYEQSDIDLNPALHEYPLTDTLKIDSKNDPLDAPLPEYIQEFLREVDLPNATDGKSHKISTEQMSEEDQTSTDTPTGTTEEPNETPSITTEIAPKKTAYKCKICKEIFNQRRLYAAHQLVHTQKPKHKLNNAVEIEVEVPIAARRCVPSDTEKSVVKPMEMLPKVGGFYQCLACKKMFMSKGLCLAHQLVHTERRPFKCSTCDMAFKTITNRNSHEKRHKPKSVDCPDCDMLFYTNSEMRNHFRTVHVEERPYLCKVCGKGFVMRSKYELHAALHATPRPYLCEQCGDTFKSKADLRNHELEHLPEPQFKCNECDKSFGLWKALHNHRRRVHKNEKKYDCRICGRQFGNYNGRNSHMRTKHPDAVRPKSKKTVVES